MDDRTYHEMAAMEGTHWWFQGRRQIVGDVLRRTLRGSRSDTSIVDLGCGTGEMLDMLLEFGTVTGLDASPLALEHSRRRFGEDVDLRLGRIPEDIPLGAQVMTAFDVIEHLEDDEAALTAIHDRLAPGGHFVCTVPAFDFLWSAHDEVHHHHRRYTRRQLRRRLEQAGFRVERITYFNTILFPLAASVRLLHRMLPGTAKGSDAREIPAPTLNRLLLRVFAAERWILRWMRLPTGVSLLAVCRRAEQGSFPAERTAPEPHRIASGSPG